MQIEGLSWFPGHMTKTKRMIVAEIRNMDAVCEILDARIPLSSRNPDVDEMTAGKPRMVVLNRVDQADPKETKRWAAYFRGKGYAVLEAEVPMAEMMSYAIDVRSMTQSRGTFVFSFVRYEDCPAAAQEKAIAEAKAMAEAE